MTSKGLKLELSEKDMILSGSLTDFSDETTDIVEEVKKEHLNYTMSDGSSVLTETLSPWRADAKQHKKVCKAKYTKKFGIDIHLHSDDSDTMIKLKEKITPKCAQFHDKKQLQEKQKKISKSVPAAFDEWLKTKNEELRNKKKKAKKQNQIKELREVAAEAEVAKKRLVTVEKWRSKKHQIENEKIAISKIKGKERANKCDFNEINADWTNKISPSEWENIREAAENMQIIEPLKLGRSAGNTELGEYLTKYVVKPDPAFRARYKHILEEAASRPTETILDGDHNESIADPATLPPKFLRMLKEEAKRLKELSAQKDNVSTSCASKISGLLEKSKRPNRKHTSKFTCKTISNWKNY